MLETAENAASSGTGPDDAAARIAVLFMRHRSRILAFLLAAVRHPQDAEDLLQDVCLIAVQRRHQYQEGTCFLAWVFKIARFRLMKYAERSQRAAAVLPEAMLDVVGADALDADDPADQEERTRAMRECLEGMKGSALAVLRMRYGRGLGISGIAQALDRTTKATYSLLDRARRALRRCTARRMARDPR